MSSREGKYSATKSARKGKIVNFVSEVRRESDRRVSRRCVPGVLNKVEVSTDDVPVRALELAKHYKLCLSHRGCGRGGEVDVCDAEGRGGRLRGEGVAEGEDKREDTTVGCPSEPYLFNVIASTELTVDEGNDTPVAEDVIFVVDDVVGKVVREGGGVIFP